MTTEAHNGITFEAFLRLVAERNLELKSQRLEVAAAEADIHTARLMNDPNVSFTYSNNDDWQMLMGQTYEVGLDWSFSLSALRARRVRAAKLGLGVAEARTEAFLLRLRADAAGAYADAWLACMTEELLHDSYNGLQTIARNDSLRLQRGEITQADAAQSRLEAISAKNEWLQAHAARINALAGLSLMTGGLAIDDTWAELPEQELIAEPLDSLIAHAVAVTPELRAARLGAKQAAEELRVVKAESAPELTLSAGYVHSREVRNELAPAPAYDGFSVGVALPLSFSAANPGVRARANAARLQADYRADQAEIATRTAVVRAYNNYLAALRALASYNDEILNDARLMIEARQRAYLSGETTIAELLSARLTYNNLRTAYLQARAACFMSEAELRAAAGL